MLAKLKDFFTTLIDQEDNSTNDHNLAISALLCEVCNADHDISKEEEKVIQSCLSKLLNIDIGQAKVLLKTAKEKITLSNSLYDFTSQLRELSYQARSDLVKSMWEVAYADNYLDPMEEHVIRKVSELIYVSHSEFIRTKLSVTEPLAEVAG